MTEMTADEQTFCSVHPDRETGLRCNRCERYMCAQCAVSTPVGYRCRECVRQVEDKFFTGTNTDNIVAFVIPAALTAVVSFLGLEIGILSMWLIGFFAGVLYGGALSQLLLRALGKRRNRYTRYIAPAGVVVGALAGVLAVYVFAGIPLDVAIELLMRSLFNIGVLVFAGVTAFIIYGRFR